MSNQEYIDVATDNLITSIEHHNEALRLFAVNIGNSLMLVHWGAIVALAAFWSTRNAELAHFRILLGVSFSTFGIGVLSCFGMQASFASYSYRLGQFYRREIKQLADLPRSFSRNEIKWHEFNTSEHAIHFYCALGLGGLSCLSMVIGFGIAVYVILSI